MYPPRLQFHCEIQKKFAIFVSVGALRIESIVTSIKTIQPTKISSHVPVVLLGAISTLALFPQSSQAASLTALPLAAANLNPADLVGVSFWFISMALVAIGTRGGAVRSSSGYAFTRIQQEADALAAAYPNLPKAGEGTFFLRTMDAIFIKAVDKHPERLPDYMRRLFQNVKPERLIRFMESCPTWLDRLAVMTALPLWPFLVAMMSIRSPTRSARL